MRNGNNLFSVIHLLIVLSLFCTGAFLLGLHHLPEVRAAVADWITSGHEHFELLAYVILGLATLLTIGFWAMQKHQFLRISMKKRHVLIDEALVRQSIRYFWRERFPTQKAPIDIYFAHQKIEIITPMPQEKKLEVTLNQIELQLGEMLHSKFGYDREFFVTLTVK